MAECSSPEKLFQDDFFSNVKTRKIEVDFEGGNVSGDGGVLLLRQVDRRIRLLLRASKILDRFDARQKGKTEHKKNTLCLCSFMVHEISGLSPFSNRILIHS